MLLVLLQSALPCETGGTGIASFLLNAERCSANWHIKHIKIITRSQLKHLSFAKQSTIGISVLMSRCVPVFYHGSECCSVYKSQFSSLESAMC